MKNCCSSPNISFHFLNCLSFLESRLKNNKLFKIQLQISISIGELVWSIFVLIEWLWLARCSTTSGTIIARIRLAEKIVNKNKLIQHFVSNNESEPTSDGTFLFFFSNGPQHRIEFFFFFNLGPTLLSRAQFCNIFPSDLSFPVQVLKYY